MPHDDETCAGCRFFDPPQLAGATRGECHHDPPVMERVNSDAFGMYRVGSWPPVEETGWCGKWERTVE